MSATEKSKYFEMLELDSDATLADVKIAYKALKNLYSQESIATIPLSDEFLDDHGEYILKQIEEAYAELSSFLQGKESASSAPQNRSSTRNDNRETPVREIDSYDGGTLRGVREALGIDIMDIAFKTKISKNFIECIELEKFDELPTKIYVRGFVFNYARYLSLDAKKVAAEYMKRYSLWERANCD